MYKFHLAIMALLSLCLIACEQNELGNSSYENTELTTRSVETFSVSFITDQQSTLSVIGYAAELTYLNSVWSNLTIDTADGPLTYVAKQISFDSSSEETLTATNDDNQVHIGTVFSIDACAEGLCLDTPISNAILQGTAFIVEDTISAM